MDTFFGIPAHPLLVHIPVVLLPLTAVGVVVMLIRPSWHLRYRWAVLAVGLVGMIGGIMAADAGESLEERIEATKGYAASRGWHDHADAGDTAQAFAIVFFAALALYILVPFFLDRWAKRNAGKGVDVTSGAGGPSSPRWLSVALAVLVGLASIGTVTTVILAGHSGSKAVWCATNTPPDCEGG
ncbi:MAG TPA: hypothetical protein PLP26_05265 [Ilumatobacteraceae bacterium]|nr:hypothetical protein [Ilumatobacteraceae bacterium]